MEEFVENIFLGKGLENRRKKLDAIREIEEVINAGRLRCEVFVSGLVRRHVERRRTVPCPPSGHRSLQIALMLSFRYGVDEADVISGLLTEVYQCEKTFEKLFAGAVFGIRASYLTSNWKSDFSTQEENLDAVEFFMERSVAFRLTFDGRRFEDVVMKNANAPPLVAASDVGNTAATSLLYRFGADLGNRVPVPRAVSLMDLCRTRIRFVLRMNWRLPYGVRELPLPDRLISYLEHPLENPEIFQGASPTIG